MWKRTPLAYLASNILSLIGVGLVTTAGVLWLLALPAYWRGDTSSPYLGILLFLALPGVFVAGLALIPIGIFLYVRKRRRAGDNGPYLPQGGELRRLGIFVAAVTSLNVVIGSQFTYRAVTYMETDSFCGQACHKVMGPELTSYSHSPHARVACVECHIGSGATFFVKAKISGTRQLLGVVFNSYPRPIPAPVEALRPASDTCEQCHWPQKFAGQKLYVHTEYASDERNSPTTNVALMKVGGERNNAPVGIHGAHAAGLGRVEYVYTDNVRQTIPQVTYTDPNGKVTTYNDTASKNKPEDLARGEHRTMDCMDCHNRPAHTFESAERAVDLAISQGRINASLPFVRKQALEALKHTYADQPSADRGISSSIEAFYREKYPQVAADTQALSGTVKTVQAIYDQNVFPSMKIAWDTYPRNLGHTDFPGCFRCHDGTHSSTDGRTISNDCSTCHDLLAVGEANPKILSDLGISTQPQGSTTGGQAK
jgi:hypothetical protein